MRTDRSTGRIFAGRDVLSDYITLRWEQPDEGIVRIVTDRPDARNAQNLQTTYEGRCLPGCHAHNPRRFETGILPCGLHPSLHKPV